MKLLLISLLAGGTCCAEFLAWSSKDGKSAELELTSVTEVDGEKVGVFRLRDGRTTKLKASQLSEDGAAKLADWKPAATAEAVVAETAAVSVFDEVLDGNLVRLSGKSLKTCKDATKPAKFYVFYYTASWCGPCQQFTPELVKFYNDNKNENFEIVLITSDSDEDAMEEYAVAKNMPWPQLKLKEVADFKKDFKHGVTGIPSVIVCDLEGNNLGNHRDLRALHKLVSK